MKKEAHKGKNVKHTNHVVWITGIVIALLLASFFISAKHAAKTKQATVAQEKEHGSQHKDYEEPQHEKETVTIQVTKDGFQPASVSAEINESVIVFINTDTVPHTVVADTIPGVTEGKFNTGVIKPGEQISAVEYIKPGTYTYYEASQPTVKGTIVAK